MNDYHYLWPLFTPDIIHARHTLRKTWRQNKICTDQAAHCGLNLGDREWVRWLVNEGLIRNELSENAISFRLESEMNAQNPYIKLITLSQKQKNIIKRIGATNWIELNGGIGDYLQDLNILKPWLENDGSTAMKIRCSQKRKDQLYRFLPNITWSTTKNEDFKGVSVSSRLLMAALGEDLKYPMGLLQSQNKSDYTQSKGLFCCWTASGEGDKLSRWIRSVTFSEVMRFYSKIIERGCIAELITDCSHWKPWEQTLLRKIGIQIYDPERGDVLDLARQVNKHKMIISIDTALIHICAAIGQRAELFLPIYHDERWYQLMGSDSCYKHFCTIIKQSSYGTWRLEIDKMILKVVHKLT